MKIGILGTGRVGGVLGRRWTAAGHDIVYGSRDAGSERVRQLVSELGPRACASDWAAALAHGEVVILATPWPQTLDVLAAAGPVEGGKILVDCSNPLTADFQGLALGYDDSAAERIAGQVPGARVVKAFNTVGTATMDNPDYGGQRATMFYCGDDQQAKAVVGQLAEQLGLEAVDAGPLQIARYLEPLAMLYIHLAVRQGWGSHCAFKILKRARS
ncbi:MAG: NADPH-dependent F420 reductase [Pirellulaceae bacterium]|nr:NADPH-dependent F420 reductase [Pirellulaceae bacterium]